MALLFNCPTPGHLHPSVPWAVGGHSPARVFLSRASQPQGFQSLWAPRPPELRAVGDRAGPVGADHRSPKLDDQCGQQKDCNLACIRGVHNGRWSSARCTVPSLHGDDSSLGTLAGASPRRHSPAPHNPEGPEQFPPAPYRGLLRQSPRSVPRPQVHLISLFKQAHSFRSHLRAQGPPIYPGPASTS